MNWSRFFNRLWCVFAFVWIVLALVGAALSDEPFSIGEILALLALGLVPTAFLLLAVGWVIDGLKKPDK